uniref:Tetraspanin 8 n=1 Tax=Ovis aries TaxID=9940 RepID=A0AC11AUR8_SHEEP
MRYGLGCWKIDVVICNISGAIKDCLKLCGAIILSVAISIRAGKIGQEIFTPGDANLSPFIAVNILIFVGAVIMILGFLGCCGAMKENQFMMILFFIGLLMILLLQVAAGILATARKSKAEQALNKTLLMNARLLSSTNENERVFQKAFSELQEELKCCGLVNGASDWGSNFRHYYKTCECPRESDSCIKYSGKTIYKQSCYASISHMFSKHLFIVTALAFGLAAIEVLGLIFSIVLYCQMRKK